LGAVLAAAAAKTAPKAAVENKNSPVSAPDGRSALSKKKLGFKQQRELEALPGLIEALEQEQKAVQTELADGSLYVKDAERAAGLTARAAKIEEELMAALERWETLGAL